MNKLLFALLLGALAGCSTVPSNWTTEDTQRESVYAVATVMDWRQTMDIARHPDRKEANTILGEHPTNEKINQYFVVAGILQYSIAAILPPEERAAWQSMGILLEVICVRNNLKLGLSIGF
jgi:hypothetical protein